jgi:hypothetical protein
MLQALRLAKATAVAVIRRRINKAANPRPGHVIFVKTPEILALEAAFLKDELKQFNALKACREACQNLKWYQQAYNPATWECSNMSTADYRAIRG